MAILNVIILRYTNSMRWRLLVLLLPVLLFPALAFAGEYCSQFGGTCKDACGANEEAEHGAFLDCTEKQQCCVQKIGRKSPPTASVVVVIDDYAFSPDTIRVKAGTEVVWKNKDSADHTVTAGDGSFGSGALISGAEFKRTFTRPGTYSYACEIHPTMTGKIVVE